MDHPDLYDEIKKMEIELAKMDVILKTLQKDVKTLVTIDRFNPVAYIAYGLAAGVLTTALGAVLSLVLIK